MTDKQNYPSHHPGEFKVDCYGVPKLLKFDFSPDFSVTLDNIIKVLHIILATNYMCIQFVCYKYLYIFDLKRVWW